MISGLPQKLKDLRMQHKLSQKEVAMQLGISPSIVSGYETGERTPSVEILLALSYLYHCSTDFLLGKTASASMLHLDLTGLRKDQVHALSLLVDSMHKA